MNLNSFLSYLIESVNIEELKNKVGDSVPQSVLDTLASKMKGSKYDKIAMEIIKLIQSFKTSGYQLTITKKNKPFYEYIEQNPGKIYLILKKVARNNPKFDPYDILHNSIEIAPESYDSPKEFWRSFFEAETSKNKKEEFGLKNAKVKKLKNEFLIFPKSFKLENEYGLQSDDLDKQWKDIKALSAEIAKKDNSGEVYEDYDSTDEDGNPKKKHANDNHWCVASSDDSYYKDYKNGGGVFIIIVKRNPDGSPNWEKRYLYFTRGKGDEDWDEEEEFANKFDVHVAPERVLSREALNIVRKINPQISKRADQENEAYLRTQHAYHDYRENAYKTGGKEWDALRTAIDIINDQIEKFNKKILYDERYTCGSMVKAIDKIIENNKSDDFGGMWDYLAKVGKEVEDDNTGKFARAKINEYNFYVGKNTYYVLRITTSTPYGKLNIVDWDASNPGMLWDKLKEFRDNCAKTPRQPIHTYYKKSFYYENKMNFDTKKFEFAPKSEYRPDSKFLKDNKKLTAAFEKLKEEGSKRPVYLTEKLSIVKNTRGRYVIVDCGHPVCNLLDPDMPKKLKEHLEKTGVAQGFDFG